MNRNVMIVLAGGFLIAVLVALLVQAGLSGNQPQEPAPVVQEVAKVNILVAAKDLKAGDKIAADTVKWMKWPENAVFPEAIKQIEQQKPEEAISGRMAREVKADAPIMTSSVLTEDSASLKALLDKGMRAYTFSVNARSMVAGFVRPGDHVDILLTYREVISIDGDNEDLRRIIDKNLDSIATETILENVKVLAVDQRSAGMIDEEDDGGPRIGTNITVAVTPKVAEVLAVASTLGQLSLALRGIGDDTVIADSGQVTTDARVTQVYDEIIAELNQAEDTAGMDTRIIRIYRGESVEDMSVAP